MIQLSVKSSTGEVRERLVLASKTLADWRPFFREFRDVWLESRREMFSTAGASTGTPWPEYSKRTGELQYAAIKAKVLGRRLGRRDLLRFIGIQSERLYPSLTDSHHVDSLYEERADEASYGSRVPWASDQDEGSGRAPDWMGGQRIPKRPILNLGPALQGDISALVSAFAAVGIHSIDEGGRDRAGLSTEEVRRLMRGEL